MTADEFGSILAIGTTHGDIYRELYEAWSDVLDRGMEQEVGDYLRAIAAREGVEVVSFGRTDKRDAYGLCVRETAIYIAYCTPPERRAEIVAELSAAPKFIT